MLTAIDPMDMTPEERRRKIRCTLAAGVLRLSPAARESLQMWNEVR